MKNLLQNKKISFISLGCDKNRVDLERVIARSASRDMVITPDPADAEICVINTCGFIGDAKKESIETIIEMGALKKENLKVLIVCGCLCNSFNLAELKAELPEVDVFVPTNAKVDITKIIENVLLKRAFPLAGSEVNADHPNRIVTTPSHYAYLKIADGCNKFCSYCLIPHIKGRLRSEKLSALVKEAKVLTKNGVKELILVAQDTTKYGEDLGMKNGLVKLIKKLSSIKRLEKIRLLYCYPDGITKPLLKEMAKNKKLCHYVDMPLQHASNAVLERMNRNNTMEEMEEKISALRLAVPDISIRTTFILGFPGETEEDVNILSRFIKRNKLNNVGFFAYSREKETVADKLKGHLSAKVKKERVNKIASVQYQISQKLLKQFKGKTLTCYVDEIDGDTALCHCDYFCPGVDSCVLVDASSLKVGDKINVLIKKVDEYDLIGVKQ